MLMEIAKTSAFWKQVRSNNAYHEILSQIKQTYQNDRWDEIPTLRYKTRMRFYGDGDRAEFERPYFRRRKFLSSAAFLALIYPEDGKYLEEVQECIWAICEEYSWCLPAHCDGTLEDDLRRIDLFSAETGFTLAEICYLLEDRLDTLVLERARIEVRNRVIANFVNAPQKWEHYATNWAAVCAGNVGGAMMYLDPDSFDSQLPRLLDTMHVFLSGFPDDGTCMEGFSYWHYGFGNFLWFADLLLQYTEGHTDLLAWDKIEAIASYPHRSFLKGNTIVSSADCSAYGAADRGMISYLHSRFPSVQLLPIDRTQYNQGGYCWMMPLRNLLYADHGAENTDFRLQDAFLPGAGQAVLHRKGYSFAIKAGHNHEPHNHNDVGSFILSTNKGQIFCDLGAGLYTRQYFRKETRYGIFCNSSLSHSVPIVNGQPQLYGEDYNGKISVDGCKICVDFANAYGQDNFQKLTRTVLCEDGFVTLTDAFSDYESLIERFVTLHKPEKYADHVVIQGVVLRFDPEYMSLSVKEESHLPHNASLPAQTVYCIDFALNAKVQDVTFTISIPEE